jgi:multidrug efflux pump subunit AcrB
MQIRTTSGETIPFSHVANATVVQAPSRIERKNGARVMQIGASSVDKSTDIISIAERAAPEIDEIVATAGGVLNWRYTGSIEEHYQTKDQNSWNWWILIIALYALLAIPFRGLLQPIFVLAAIPFGLIGALIGHVIMDIPLTHLSSFGMMALAGVVVNDSLVMVDFANRRKRDGADVREAILMSGVARFRPIVLTSLTTFVGLLPLILDKSIQAQFLIPMAVSLAFGILFSTAVTLLLIPCFYLAFEDGKELFLKAWRWYFNPFKAEPETSIPPPPPPTPPSAPPRH